MGIFSFHCVQCWDKLPYSLIFKCWDLSGAVVYIIIPWGKTMISEEFREVLLPFSTWGFLEAILRMLPSSWMSPLQYKMPPHFRDPQVQHHLLGASYFGALGLWVLWTHLGGLQALLSCSSPEPPSCHLPALCPWCHVGHWKEVKALHYWKQITSYSGSE